PYLRRTPSYRNKPDLGEKDKRTKTGRKTRQDMPLHRDKSRTRGNNRVRKNTNTPIQTRRYQAAREFSAAAWCPSCPSDPSLVPPQFDRRLVLMSLRRKPPSLFARWLTPAGEWPSQASHGR